MRLIMEEVELKQEDRAPVKPAREYAKRLMKRAADNEIPAVIAFELNDGRIITGRTSDLMDASSSAILNAIKALANISDDILLLSPVILEPIKKLKSEGLHKRIPTLTANEILIALSISAVTNPTAQLAYEKLSELKDVQAHSTVILNKDDDQILRNLGLDITCDPVYPSENLYYV
jgi:uncharacterized protein (UPF0371 family)